MEDSLPTLLSSDRLSSTNSQQLISKLAAHIRRAKLESVAIFLLEAQKPFTGALYAGAVGLQPAGELLFGKDRWSFLQSLLADRRHIESLIKLLENPLDNDCMLAEKR